MSGESDRVEEFESCVGVVSGVDGMVEKLSG